MALNENIKQTLDMTQEMLDSDEMEEIVKSTARLTVLFYKEVHALGIDPEHAATIAAAFASSSKVST